MDDLIFSIVGANSPPSVQSSSNSYQDAKKTSDGQSFQEELNAQETRQTSQDRSNSKQTTTTDTNSYGIRDDSPVIDVKTRTDKNGVNQKADTSKSSSGTSSAQSKKTDDAADDDSDQDHSDDQNADDTTDPQAQAAAAAAAAQAQNTDEPKITDEDAAQMVDAAMEAISAVTGTGTADTAAALSEITDSTATIADGAAQVDPTVIASQNAMQVQAAPLPADGDATAAQSNTDVQSAAQTKQEAQTQQNMAANAAVNVKTTENGETTSTKSGTTSQSSTITAAAGIFEGSSNTQTNNVTSTVNVEPARLAEARAQDIIAQVTRSMDAVIKSGQSYMKIQLYPENLGRIDLRLTSSNQGLVVTMVAESSSTGSMLESQLSTLRQSLSDAGIQLAHLGVGGGGSNNQPGQQSGRWQNSSSSLRGWTEFGSNDDSSDDLQVNRKSLSNNGVDYKV
jgi:flagellar hook-length control protein FliK